MAQIHISVSQIIHLVCEQKKKRDRWTESEGKRRVRWIIAESEKELTLLLSHYCSSGGTNG